MANKLFFTERSEQAVQPKAKALFSIAAEKKSNLILSADVTDKSTLLDLARTLGPRLCALKTHIDIVDDADLDFCRELKAIAKQQQFLIIEDRKCADIGHTTLLQMTHGAFRFTEWVDMITVHSLPGASIIQAFSEVNPCIGVLLLAQMSSKENFFTPAYTQKTTELAKKYPDIVAGTIAQNNTHLPPSYVVITPGVQLLTDNDRLGQQYRTPQTAICEQGCDFVIVGRGIINAPSPLETAIQYQQSALDAYQSLCHSC